MVYRKARYDREPVMDVDDEDFEVPGGFEPPVLPARNEPERRDDAKKEPEQANDAEGVTRLVVSLSAILPANGVDSAASLVVVHFNGTPVMQRAGDWLLVAKKLESWANQAIAVSESV